MERITKEEAWERLEGEKSIPIKRDYSYKFTRNWFKNRNQVTFSTFLPDRYAGKPINMIQIGVFEGMDLVWCFQNILTHPDSRCFAVDPWGPNKKHDMEEVMSRAHHNLRPFRKRLHLERGYSKNALNKLDGGVVIEDKPIKPGEWDLVIIDGDHNAPAVYTDAMLSLNLVKVGGWLLFDDVRNNNFKKNHVFNGIEEFVEDFRDQVELVWFHRHCDCYERIE